MNEFINKVSCFKYFALSSTFRGKFLFKIGNKFSVCDESSCFLFHYLEVSDGMIFLFCLLIPDKMNSLKSRDGKTGLLMGGQNPEKWADSVWTYQILSDITSLDFLPQDFSEAEGLLTQNFLRTKN